MALAGIGGTAALSLQAIADMRSQLDDLQRQLGTGKKADSYAGLGLDRGLTIGLRAHLSTIASYGDSINNVGVRLNIAQTTLSRIAAIGREAKAGVVQSTFDADGTGQTTTQKTAQSQLGEILGLLNTQAGDRYLFSGRSGDQPAVESLQHILDGDGTRAGLKQLIAE